MQLTKKRLVYSPLLFLMAFFLTGSIRAQETTVVDTSPDFPPNPPSFQAGDSVITYHYLYVGTPSWGPGGVAFSVQWKTEEDYNITRTNGTNFGTNRNTEHAYTYYMDSACTGHISNLFYDNYCNTNGCVSDESSPLTPFFMPAESWFAGVDGINTGTGGAGNGNDIDHDLTTNDVPNGYRIQGDSFYDVNMPREFAGGDGHGGDCYWPSYHASGKGEYWELYLTITNSTTTNSSGSPSSFQSSYSIGGGSPLANPTSLSFDSSNHFSVAVSVQSNVSYTLSASTNLTSWTNIGTFMFADTNAIFADAAATNFDHRFYRYTDGTNDSEIFAFIKLVEPPGNSMITDPLSGVAGVTLDVLLTNVPNGTTISKWNAGAQAYDPTYTFSSGSWSPDGSATLMPSEAAFINVAGTNSITLTFYGLVNQGSNTCTIPPNQSFRGSMLPISEGLDTEQFPDQDGDMIYFYINGTGFTLFQYYEGFGWYNGDYGEGQPVPAAGQGFIVISPVTTNRTWTTDLSVSP